MTRQQQYFSGVPLATVQQNLARNAFMAHPENVVLAMMVEEDGEARSQAVTLIRAARQHRKLGPVRKIKCPQVTFDASTCREMMDVAKTAEDSDIETPYVRLMSDDELQNLHLTPPKTGLLCHAQSTQPGIAEVTAFREASLAIGAANTARAAARPCCHLLAGSVPKRAVGRFQPMPRAKNIKKEVKMVLWDSQRSVLPFHS